MKVEIMGDEISINLDAYHGDEFYFATHSLTKDNRSNPDLTLNLCLDRAIELRDKLSKVIEVEVAKLNKQFAIKNPEQVATELADVIDWQFKEA